MRVRSSVGERAEVVLSTSVEESMSSDILVWKSKVDLLCIEVEVKDSVNGKL